MSEQTPHIIDQLIEERATRLMAHPLLWNLVRRFFYPLLGYHRAVEVTNQVSTFDGLSVFTQLSSDLQLEVETIGISAIPESGAAIIVANHPAGIADGIAVFDMVKSIRTDITFFANRDAIRAAPGLADMIIPVEWLEARRSRDRSKETVRHMVKAFRNERLIVIFPSGRLAQPTFKGLIERPWMSSAVGLAQKYDCPIIPLHIRARSSFIYYLCYLIHSELRDMTLFRELFNKQGARYRMTLGKPLQAGGDPKLVTELLREFVVTDLKAGHRDFKPTQNTTSASALHPYNSGVPALQNPSDTP